jgi:hypothetical protein
MAYTLICFTAYCEALAEILSPLFTSLPLARAIPRVFFRGRGGSTILLGR